MAAMECHVRPAEIPGTPRTHLKNSTVHVTEISPSASSSGTPVSEVIPAYSQKGNHLEVSPYLEDSHLLDLRTVDAPNRLFAQALTVLDSNDDSYAITDYRQAMNWPNVMAKLRELASEEGFTWKRHVFYVVEFRSKLKSQIDNQKLFQLDKESHREATESGGLLKYWFGSPDSERRNLATCEFHPQSLSDWANRWWRLHLLTGLGLWRSKEDAIAGGKGPWHRKARGVIIQMYEDINVKGLRLTIEDGANEWSFAPWEA